MPPTSNRKGPDERSPSVAPVNREAPTRPEKPVPKPDGWDGPAHRGNRDAPARAVAKDAPARVVDRDAPTRPEAPVPKPADWDAPAGAAPPPRPAASKPTKSRRAALDAAPPPRRWPRWALAALLIAAALAVAGAAAFGLSRNSPEQPGSSPGERSGD